MEKFLEIMDKIAIGILISVAIILWLGIPVAGICMIIFADEEIRYLGIIPLIAWLLLNCVMYIDSRFN